MKSKFRQYSKELESKITLPLEELFGPEIFDTAAIEQRFLKIKEIFAPFKASYQKSKTKIITICGTNGKGETAHILEFLLRKNGAKVGLWTSPHILSIRERFHFDGELIDYQRLNLLIQKSLTLGRVEKLSYYEFLFLIFNQIACSGPRYDYLIFEVGLGGRLDTVNLFDADIVGLTSISLDHTEILGDKEEKILIEKLGVTRPGEKLFYNLEKKEIAGLCQDYCKANNIDSKEVLEREAYAKPYNEQNRLLAISLFESLTGIQVKENIKLLEEAKQLELSGRFEKVTLEGKSFIFIGAHNIDGLAKMKGRLELEDPLNVDRKAIFSFSKRPIREVIKGLTLLFEGRECLFKEICFFYFKHPKAMEEENIKKVCNYFEKNTVINIKYKGPYSKESLLSFSDQSSSTIIAGSYYFIGKIQEDFSSSFS